MQYDPSQYETVKQRKTRFYGDHKDGRISVEIVTEDLDLKAVVKAQVFLNKEDQEKKLPRGEGYALEIRDTEKKVSGRGKEYESVNFTSWLENAEESAVGRALDNAGYASNGKCSLDEMEKAQRNSAAIPATRPAPSHGGSGAYCVLCKSELKLSKAGTRFYCQNFKDTKDGEHTAILATELVAFKSWQSNTPPPATGETDVPF